MGDKTDSLDYKNISLIPTGQISSGCITRSNLMQPTKQTATSFMDIIEDDDEQFILNLKKNIDDNYKMRNKENYNFNSSNKTYLSRKKKSAFSDEDQNLVKRFKKSIDESKIHCITSQKLEKSEKINHLNDRNSLVPTSTEKPLFTPIASLNNIDTNLRANQFFFHVTSKMQNNQMTPDITKIETEIEQQFIYYELQYLTPPHEIE
ncbi:uncharacterized protein LOC105187614 [Harpegnathos saltator]|uniref:uncharacterized protein LOC105187614 n=1 Tax=Harpegnathos saltator TaxID=610380 RepID=UPI000948A2F5|nr:uncharacterized protein LOC105187614 [Harpegnathos saltator]